MKHVPNSFDILLLVPLEVSAEHAELRIFERRSFDSHRDAALVGIRKVQKSQNRVRADTHIPAKASSFAFR